MNAFTRHAESAHEPQDHREGVLTRLWLFQEILLSDSIQFVRCSGLEQERQQRILQNPHSPGLQYYDFWGQLFILSTSWAIYGGL